MSNATKILLSNFVILLIVIAAIQLSHERSSQQELQAMVTTMILVLLQAGINLMLAIVCFASSRRTTGLRFLLATFAVLVVGCIGCFASAG